MTAEQVLVQWQARINVEPAELDTTRSGDRLPEARILGYIEVSSQGIGNMPVIYGGLQPRVISIPYIVAVSFIH